MKTAPPQLLVLVAALLTVYTAQAQDGEPKTSTITLEGEAIAPDAGEAYQQELLALVVSREDAIQACYTSALERNPDLGSGFIELRMDIGESGHVQEVALVLDELGDVGLTTCVQDVARAWVFPHPETGVHELFYPFEFGERGKKLEMQKPRPTSIEKDVSDSGEKETLSKGAILQVVRGNQRDIRTCYNKALEQNPGLQSGRVDVTFTILPSGKLSDPSVRADTIGEPALATCITNAMRRWRFPDSKKPLKITFPFKLP